jgi:hypothetical protein
MAEMGNTIAMDLQDAVWMVVDWIHLIKYKNQ